MSVFAEFNHIARKRKQEEMGQGKSHECYGEPTTPISESLANAEVASHSSAEGRSDSGSPGSDFVVPFVPFGEGART
jgi:hypothetical protein